MLKSSSYPLTLTGLLTVSLLFTQPAAADDYILHRGFLGLTYDPVTLSNNESLGLLGLHALMSKGEYAYLGVSGFGAVTGERGGFIAGGYSAGLHIPFNDRFNTDLSIFVGAGGGGAAPQGGGLMVREQVGLDYFAHSYQVGAGISHVHFPNGEIDSIQPYLSFQIPFTTLYASGWEAGELSPVDFSTPLYDRDSSIALSFKRYRGSSLFHSYAQPADSISMFGVEWQQDAHGGFYYTLSTHGAYAGGADGYAEVMAGGGYHWQLSRKTSFGIAMALGSGGGGNVDTGRGLLGSLTINMEQKLTRQLFLSMQGGYTGAMHGEFGGSVVGIALGMRHITPVTTGWEESEPAALPYAATRYRLSLLQQRYYPGTAVQRSDPSKDRNIDLTGLQINMMTGKYFYLTGQALEAWRGEAGGYASGMVGGGLSLPVSRHFALNGELLAGTAGGGGIDVGDGLLAGATISAIAHLSSSLDLEVGWGRVAAYNGGLDAHQLTMAIAYRFIRPER